MIAEDIRFETGGKFSLMGIYGDSLDVNLPADAPDTCSTALSLVSFVTLEHTQSDTVPGDYNIQIVAGLSATEIFNMNARIESPARGGTFHLPTPKFTFQVAEADILKIHVVITTREAFVATGSATLAINIRRAPPG